MSIPCKFERSILSHDEHEVILRSHHPEIYEVGLDDLKALRQRLREMRSRERTLAHAKRREARGKGRPKGQSFPGTAEHPLWRKQVFAAALKRVNREIDRMQKLEARAAHIEAVRRASRYARAATLRVGASSSINIGHSHGQIVVQLLPPIGGHYQACLRCRLCAIAGYWPNLKVYPTGRKKSESGSTVQPISW